MMILVVSLSVNLDAGRTTLTMTPMNVGKARASQVAARAGRKDAAGALIADNSDDVSLVPRGSRPQASGRILRPHQWFSLRLVKDGVSDPRVFLMIQSLSILN